MHSSQHAKVEMPKIDAVNSLVVLHVTLAIAALLRVTVAKDQTSVRLQTVSLNTVLPRMLTRFLLVVAHAIPLVLRTALCFMAERVSTCAQNPDRLPSLTMMGLTSTPLTCWTCSSHMASRPLSLSLVSILARAVSMTPRRHGPA